jgi:hypothetical protein
MRTWIGTVGFAVLAIAVGIVSVTWHWNVWFTLATVVLCITFAYLLMPMAGSAGTAEKTGTAFIRGDASGSRMHNVLVEGADTFVGGSAKDAVLTNIIFRAREVKRWWRR